jgi:hypothetical protein
MNRDCNCPERHSEMAMMFARQRNPILRGKVFQKRKSERRLFSFQSVLTRPKTREISCTDLENSLGLDESPVHLDLFLESLFFSGPFSLVLFFRVFPSRWLRRRGRERERRLCAERRWVKVRTTVLSRCYRLVREYEVARDTRTRGRCRAGRGWKGRKRNHEGTR